MAGYVVRALGLSLACVLSTYGLPNMNTIDLPTEGYIKDADIQLGVIDLVYSIVTSGQYSRHNDHKMGNARYYQYQSMIYWRLQQINKDQTILPNVSIGWTVVADGGKSQIALARSVLFIRNRDECPVESSPFDVSAVLSLSYSSSTILAANLMKTYKLPLVSIWATSEELNSKSKFPYYSRIVPSDLFQARTIVDLLVKYNWTYVAMITDEGNYGRNLAKVVIQRTSDAGICVPINIVSSNTKAQIPSHVDTVSDTIVNNKEIKVVIMILHDKAAHFHTKRIYEKLAGSRNIVYIMSDSVAAFNRLFYGAQYITDSFLIRMYGNYLPDEFYESYESITGNNTDNTWIPFMFEQQNNCSWKGNQGYSTCDPNLQIGQLDTWSRSHLGTLVTDSIDAIANAFHLHLDETCPEVFKGTYSREYVRECGKKHGESLMEKLKISMSKYAGKYLISQMQKKVDGPDYELRTVGTWRLDKLALNLDDSTIQWRDLIKYGVRLGENFTAADGNISLNGVPRSKCSWPCLDKQYAMQMPVKCCWDCRYCGVNEIIINNHTGCSACDIFYWPDAVTSTFCEEIPPTFYELTSSTTRLVMSFSAVGLVISLSILVFFVANRKVRIIKATGFKISILSQVGVSFEYISAIVIICPPTIVSCYTGYIFMNIGFCVVFAALLMKTNRIYRIFKAAKKGAFVPKFTKDKHLMIIINILVAVQIIIIYITYMVSPPQLQMKMKLRTEYFVELACINSTICFLLPIAYNIVLLLVCCSYTIKTRKLPDNFNESKLIFLYVVSTIFLSVAFIPTYISAEREKQKISLLCMLLLISGYLSSTCLHIPKIYAIVCYDEMMQEGGTSVGITIKSKPVNQTSQKSTEKTDSNKE